MKPNINMYMIYTKILCNLQSNFLTPTFSNGSQFIIKDCGSFANSSNIYILGNNSDLFENMSTDKLINTSLATHRFVYSGSGNNGTLFSI